jgi:2-dehydropantoate 2-reductase
MQRAAQIPALAAVVYVAVQMIAPGQVKHTARGDLILGDSLAEAGVVRPRPETLELVNDLFAEAGVPCRVSREIRSELWTKLAMNCAYNAVSALAGVPYGTIAADAGCRSLIERVLGELVEVADSAGVRLSREELLRSAWRLGDAMPEALSSTGQDLTRGKHTEIDALNGFVVQAGAGLGIATPVNQALHALVKLAEGRPRQPAPVPLSRDARP